MSLSFSTAKAILRVLTASTQATVTMCPAAPEDGVLERVSVEVEVFGERVQGGGDTFEQAVCACAEAALEVASSHAADQVKRVNAAKAMMPVPSMAEQVRSAMQPAISEAAEAAARAVPKRPAPPVSPPPSQDQPLPRYQGKPPSAEDMFRRPGRGAGDDVTFAQYVKWCAQAQTQEQLDKLVGILKRMQDRYSVTERTDADVALARAGERLGRVAG